ncbi:hypothetical protein NKR19_g695 [Coniochaeta hoffmannii]|uniref:Uncharacterized protein n=1 Tax=Coniochaeta hoffmannii TaxID=91930 RepID=A0AA38SLR1_9PEZI|nr:hypothetical protein NKR19_g695 [Coniochaeta hoffmannii]
MASKSPPWGHAWKVPSLVELCIKTLVKNIDEASAEALECLPVPLLWRVYRLYLCTTPETIRLWRVFSTILVRELPRVPLPLYWFRWEPNAPNAKQDDLPRLMQLSTSPSVDFVTHLTLHKVWMFRASDLMALADMPNLGILQLSDLLSQTQYEMDESGGEAPINTVDSCLNDRLVRGWSEKEKPFLNLRVLMMTSVHSTVTVTTLQYASRFPSLVHCILRSVSLPDREREASKQAETLGWRMQPDLRPWEYSIPPERRAKDDIRPLDATRSVLPDLWLSRRRLAAFEAVPRGGVFLSPSTGATPSTLPDTRETTADAEAEYRSWHSFQQTLDWIMWSLYSAIGEQIGNADLLEQGVELHHRATHQGSTLGYDLESTGGVGERLHPWGGQIVLPPKPMLSVVLGRPWAHYTYLREVRATSA